MKQRKWFSVALIFTALSAFAMNSGRESHEKKDFPQFTKEVIQNAILGSKKAIFSITGACNRSDQRKVQDLLTTISGCRLNEQSEMTLECDAQKTCLRNLKERWVSIESIDCKQSFLVDTLQLIRGNLLNYLNWTFLAQDAEAFDQRLTQFLELLSLWENETRNSLYLSDDLVQAKGINEFYLRFSDDLNLVHARLADSLFKLLKNRIENQKDWFNQSFFQKEIPSAIITQKLYNQENPGSVSLIHFTTLLLNSTLERIKFLVSLTDLGCSLQLGCNQDELNQSEVYLVLFLTSIMDQSDLSQNDWSSPIGALKGKTREAFLQIFNHHKKLTQALRVGMTNKNIPIHEAVVEQFEPLAFPFVALIREAKSLIDSLNKRRQFAYKEKEYLGSLTQDRMESLNRGLDGLKEFLIRQRDSYRTEKGNLAQTLIAINESQNRSDTAAALINSVGFELRMAQLDLEGLQSALRKESESLSQLTARSATLIQNEKYQNRFLHGAFTTIQEFTFSVSAQNAYFERAKNFTHIAQFAVKGTNGEVQKLTAEKGDLVTAEVTGQYSPTCAISQEYKDFAGLNKALTGPEGFIVNTSNRQLRATSSTDTTGNRQTESTNTNYTEYLEGCGSTSISDSVSTTVSADVKPFGIGGGISVSYSHSWGRSQPENCKDKVMTRSYSTEISQTESRINSDEMVQNATFERGMRSPFAPFSTVPVGALVMVEVDRDSQKVRHMRVVHRNTAFTVSQASDLYFVVNDCQMQSASKSPLTIKVSQKRSVVNTSQVSFLMTIITDLAEVMGIHLKHYLNQGGISGDEMEAIRRNLRILVDEKIATREGGFFLLRDFPLINEWVENWITSEVVQLERKIRIRQTEQKIKLLYIKHRDLVNQSLHHQRDTVLNSMMMDWSYQNMDYRALMTGIQRMVSYLNYRVLPAYQTIKPGVLSGATEELRRYLKNINLETDPEELARALINFVDHLNFNELINTPVRYHSGKVVVSFPRPEKYEQIQKEDHMIYESTSIWSSVPFLEANRVWNEVDQRGKKISLTVLPNDLYNPHVLFGSLMCNQRAPFVKGMSVFFVLGDEDYSSALNALQPNRPVLLPEFVQVPNPEGLEFFHVPLSFRKDIMPIRFSSSGQAFEVVNSTNVLAGGAARGISPVGSFILSDMKAFYQFPAIAKMLDRLEEILIMFDVESISGDQDLDWIPNCQRKG